MRFTLRFRFTLLAALAALAFAASPARAQDYTDIWYNAGESGWGVNVVQADNFLFLTFFIYGQDKKPTWYTGQLTWDGSKYTGGLYLSTGSWYAGPWVKGDSSIQPVGTATFQPSNQNAYEATLTYTVNGVGTVIKPIERQTLTYIELQGTYVGGQSGVYSSCPKPSDNVKYNDTFGTLSVARAGNNFLTLSFSYDSGANCTISGTFEQHGQLYRMPGARYQCTGFLQFDTTATVYELKQTAQGIEGRLAATLPGGCQESGAFSGALQF